VPSLLTCTARGFTNPDKVTIAEPKVPSAFTTYFDTVFVPLTIQRLSEPSTHKLVGLGKDKV
jgi:hypothetical protein